MAHPARKEKNRRGSNRPWYLIGWRGSYEEFLQQLIAHYVQIHKSYLAVKRHEERHNGTITS